MEASDAGPIRVLQRSAEQHSLMEITPPLIGRKRRMQRRGGKDREEGRNGEERMGRQTPFVITLKQTNE